MKLSTSELSSITKVERELGLIFHSWFCGFVCVNDGSIFVQKFDDGHGMGWQCVVGSNFGSFFTHSQGTFIYFTLETLNFLIFKGPSPSVSSRVDIV